MALLVAQKHDGTATLLPTVRVPCHATVAGVPSQDKDKLLVFSRMFTFGTCGHRGVEKETKDLILLKPIASRGNGPVSLAATPHDTWGWHPAKERCPDPEKVDKCTIEVPCPPFPDTRFWRGIAYDCWGKDGVGVLNSASSSVSPEIALREAMRMLSFCQRMGDMDWALAGQITASLRYRTTAPRSATVTGALIDGSVVVTSSHLRALSGLRWGPWPEDSAPPTLTITVVSGPIRGAAPKLYGELSIPRKLFDLNRSLLTRGLFPVVPVYYDLNANYYQMNGGFLSMCFGDLNGDHLKHSSTASTPQFLQNTQKASSTNELPGDTHTIPFPTGWEEVLEYLCKGLNRITPPDNRRGALGYQLGVTQKCPWAVCVGNAWKWVQPVGHHLVEIDPEEPLSKEVLAARETWRAVGKLRPITAVRITVSDGRAYWGPSKAITSCKMCGMATFVEKTATGYTVDAKYVGYGSRKNRWYLRSRCGSWLAVDSETARPGYFWYGSVSGKPVWENYGDRHSAQLACSANHVMTGVGALNEHHRSRKTCWACGQSAPACRQVGNAPGMKRCTLCGTFQLYHRPKGAPGLVICFQTVGLGLFVFPRLGRVFLGGTLAPTIPNSRKQREAFTDAMDQAFDLPPGAAMTGTNLKFKEVYPEEEEAALKDLTKIGLAKAKLMMMRGARKRYDAWKALSTKEPLTPYNGC